MASSFGYTNASWTLKCDLTCEYVCRLINYMDRHGYKQCMPHNRRSHDHGIAVAGFLLRLCAALGRENAEAGLEAAVAAVPELRARHRHAALRQGRRRRDAVFVIEAMHPPDSSGGIRKRGSKIVAAISARKLPYPASGRPVSLTFHQDAIRQANAARFEERRLSANGKGPDTHRARSHASF